MRAEIGACTLSANDGLVQALVEKYGMPRASRPQTEPSSTSTAQDDAEAEIRSHPERRLREARPSSTSTARTADPKLHDTRQDHRRSVDRIIFDYSDTDGQTNGFVNGTYTSSASATILTFLQMVNPDIPHNEGMVEPDRDRSSPRGRS